MNRLSLFWKRLKQKALNKVPGDFSRSIILNLLGFQIYRIWFFALVRALHTEKQVLPEHREYVDTLKRDGFVIIPDFLPADIFHKIRDEYLVLTPQFVESVSGVRLVLPHTSTLNIYDNRVSQFFRDQFLQSGLIQDVVRGFLKKDYRLPMNIRLTRIFCSKDELHLPMYGGTNNLHFDAPLKTLKAFYYLSDTSEKNAALRYCRGSSHRNSIRRLWFEYVLSVRYAFNRWNPNHGGEYQDGSPWVKVSEKEQRQYGLRETSVDVAANTLVFVNTGGFHRRGRFDGSLPRETVEINYRKADSLSNELASFSKHTPA